MTISRPPDCGSSETEYILLVIVFGRSAPQRKSEADIKKEIQGVIKQITASVTFLPLLETACECKFIICKA